MALSCIAVSKLSLTFVTAIAKISLNNMAVMANIEQKLYKR